MREGQKMNSWLWSLHGGYKGMEKGVSTDWVLGKSTWRVRHTVPKSGSAPESLA